MTQAEERSDEDTSQVRDLDAVAADLLERVPLEADDAGASPRPAPRRARCFRRRHPPGRPGPVRLLTDGAGWELGEGDHIQIPATRHRLESLDDAAALLTVAGTQSG